MPVVASFISNVVSQLGVPYVFGGDSPRGTPGIPAGAFDCSGLMYWAANAAGFVIPRTSEEQFAALPLVSSPLAGDLVFFDVPGDGQAPPGHVGMCTAAGCAQMIDAPYTGVNVRYDSTAGVGTIMGYGRLPYSGPPVGPYAQGWAVGLRI